MRRLLLFFLILLLCKNLANAQSDSTGKVNFDNQVFTVVEEMPRYKGGDDARIRFLIENIKYPAVAKETGIQGTVYLMLTIDQDGTISDVKVIKGIGGGCDEESVRVAKLMPPWIPGKQNGKPVKVRMTMQLKFVNDNIKPTINKEFESKRKSSKKKNKE